MSRDWDATLNYWSSPPSETERTKCENAERVIKNALNSCPVLSKRNINVFAQGSYKNRTNVRADSDVDICVLCTNTFFFDLTFGEGLTRENLGITPATYEYETFRTEVHNALVNELGSRAVTPGDKAFDVHETSYRVDADVVPCFEHRIYTGKPSSFNIEYGTALQPRVGARIYNFPNQHYKNGVFKHEQTSKRFKKIVRTLKNLRGEMPDFKDMPSFLLECLAWNAPDYCYGHGTLAEDLHSILANLWTRTRGGENCSGWTEISGLKFLFHHSQPWKQADAERFLAAAWKHIEY
jgi:hypothetical protein